MDKPSISVVVPSKNRRESLHECIKSISNQSELPEEIIVVDDSNPQQRSESSIEKLTPDSVRLVYTSCQGPSGTSTARNTGARLSNEDVILILDDDIVLGKKYIERLKMSYLENDSNTLAGIGGFDKSDLRSVSFWERLYNRIFSLASDGWRLNEYGIQNWDANVDEPTEADWLSGNNASFKRDILLDHPYPHWLGGREALEDVAIGMNLKQNGYHCIVNPRLPVSHNEGEFVESQFRIGKKLGQNRINIFSEYSQNSNIVVFLWILFGLFLRQILAPIHNGRLILHWKKGLGIAFGYVSNSKKLIQG